MELEKAGELMFLNCSNHKSELWGQEQKQAAQMWGRIVDYSFPDVPADSDEYEIEKMAQKEAEDIIARNPNAVMCQGEFTLTYALVKKLKDVGITVVSACSDRKVTEKILPDGSTKKESSFRFVRFRKY